MRNSLKKLMFVALTTTMLSSAGANAAAKDDALGNTGIPKPTLAAVTAAAPMPVDDDKPACGCGLWSAIKKIFTKKNIDSALNATSVLGNVVTNIGAVVDKDHAAVWTNVQSGISGGVAVAHTIVDTASGPDGRPTASSIISALAQGTSGTATLVGQLDPSLQPVALKVSQGATVMGSSLHQAVSDLSNGVSASSVVHALTSVTNGAIGVAADNTSGSAHAAVERAALITNIATATVSGMINSASPISVSGAAV